MDIQKFLTLNSNKVIGLDVGTSYVSLVEASHSDDGLRVTSARKERIPESESDTKHSRDIKTLRAISDCYNSSRMSAKNAVCSVCGPEVAVRDFEFPWLPSDEIEGAINLEAGQLCPFDAEKATTDYQLFENSDNGIRGIFVSATKDLIRKRVRLAKNASFNCVLLDVDGLALLNCFEEYHKPEQTPSAVILNVNDCNATLAVMLNDHLPFIRDIVYSNQSLARQISVRYEMPVDESDNIVAESVLNGGMPEKFSEIISNNVDQLAEDISDTLRYYATQGKSHAVKKVFVCGSFARLFFDQLKQRLNSSMVLWNPFEQLPCKVLPECEDFVKDQGHTMALAAGLAMRKV